MSRAFRIERYLDPVETVEFTPKSQNKDQDTRHKEIMDKLNSIEAALANGGGGSADVLAFHAEQAKQAANDPIHAEVEKKRAELIHMKNEMREIYKAIDDTKTQILTIKESGANGQQMARAAEELSMIVKGTEEATNNILCAAELIEGNAANLVASIESESQQAMACEIQEQIVGIFEACNFQDLTGQRITKVVKTFCFIEQRVLKMIDIWGGPESFLNVTPEELESRQGDGALLNGPSLENETSIANQDDIDALFD